MSHRLARRADRQWLIDSRRRRNEDQNEEPQVHRRMIGGTPLLGRKASRPRLQLRKPPEHVEACAICSNRGRADIESLVAAPAVLRYDRIVREPRCMLQERRKANLDLWPAKCGSSVAALRPWPLGSMDRATTCRARQVLCHNSDVMQFVRRA